MCNSCGVSGCSCTKKRHCSSVDKVLVPGPAGADGADGAQGEQGIQGPPGVGGGLQYEHYFTTPLDITWTEGQVVQPEFNHTVGADANYQISLNLRVSCNGNGFPCHGNVALYINNVQVDLVNVVTTTILSSGQQIYLENTIFWRGAMLSGQTIQVKHLATTNSLIASVHGSMLVNKES
jgi:hypothetical protein